MNTFARDVAMLSTFAILVAPHVGRALFITEIMYDSSGSDTGVEWIEVFNNGTSSVEIARARLHDGKSNHIIQLVRGDVTLAPGAYAILARDAIAFDTTYTSASALFRSSFSLNNTATTISIRDGNTRVLDTVTYNKSLGAGGDGNTLNRESVGVSLVARAPSPGAPMKQTSIATLPKEKPVVASRAKSKSKTAVVVDTNASYERAITEVDEASSGTNNSLSSDLTQTASEKSNAPSSQWFLALFGIVALAIAAIFAARHFAKREWDIVEESQE